MSAKMGTCSVCEELKRLTPTGMIYAHKAIFQVSECKGSRRPERQYFEKRDFDAIVESQKAEPATVNTLWDGVKALWGPLHGDEGYLVKGMIVLECVDTDGQPNFMWMTSPYLSDWDVKGMLSQMHDDLQSDSLINSMFKALAEAQQIDEDEDEIEDDQ